MIFLNSLPLSAKSSYRLVKVAAVLLITVCIADLLVLFILGNYYPGYSQLKNSISSLGASISPVSNLISAWWIIIGIIFTFIGIIFRKAFVAEGKYAVWASWLIIIYGIGEGIGSGAFKANHYEHYIAPSLLIHDGLGGFGDAAVIILPIVMIKLFPKKELQWFYKLSVAVFVTGIVSTFFFLFRFSNDPDNFLTVYEGMWQRILLVNTYLYFVIIAFLMLKRGKIMKKELLQQKS